MIFAQEGPTLRQAETLVGVFGEQANRGKAPKQPVKQRRIGADFRRHRHRARRPFCGKTIEHAERRTA